MTDEHEHAMKVAEQAYSAGNLVTCDGYYEFDLDAAQAAIAAVYAPRLAELEAEVVRLREALEHVVNPLAVMRRKAEAEGRCLSGMAYSIATDLGFVQNIARTALGASHDD